MFKFLLVGVILSQNCFCNIFAAPSYDDSTHTSTPITPRTSQSNITDIDEKIFFAGNYNFDATHQTFYLNAPYGWRGSVVRLSADYVDDGIRSDYTVTDGIGAHKVHRRKFSWNKARKTCVEEGGHLAIIRTIAEEKIIIQMLLDNSFTNAWVGYHDQFEEGDWITVLDEPLATIPWAAWSTAFETNPDNAGGHENCAAFITGKSGLNDDNCGKELPFVCKISTY